MLTMQAFHKWLTSPGKTPRARQSRLVQLTRVNRDQIKSVFSELYWFIWDAPQGTS